MTVVCRNPTHRSASLHVQDRGNLEWECVHPECRTPRELVWPVEIGGNRGWPLPDAAWDPCGSGRWATTSPAGWLPWAVWQADAGWYVAFYTCDRGHAWTCGYGSLAGYSELRRYRRSPARIVPTDEYLRRHVADPGAIRLRLIAWPPS